MEKATELEYLKYFYQQADFGPADGDVRMGIQRNFKAETGKELPKGYYDYDEEEDENGN